MTITLIHVRNKITCRATLTLTESLNHCQIPHPSPKVANARGPEILHDPDINASFICLQSIEKHAKVPNGYTSLANVKSEKPVQRDMMETFFLSEMLKYLYLLFSDNRYTIDLSKYVINSEAHPLPIHKN